MSDELSIEVDPVLPSADVCPECGSEDVWSDVAEEIAECRSCGFSCYVGPMSDGYTWTDWFDR